ncbi:MAG: tRNA dihydrouridine synthase DusB [Clostridia bacterium]|nr:tRNA dihydrouridine synthase DusB [Clostridia bacterium]
MIRLGNLTLRHGLCLAPMAGYTDSAMRQIAGRYGAEYAVSEMISAKAVCYGDQKTPLLARIDRAEPPTAIQLFGSEPKNLAEAARILADGANGGIPPVAIDINMGCPVAKIANNGDGSALMRDPHLIERIVRAVRDAVTLPVTVKIRTGWDDAHKNAVDCARAAEAGGAELLCIHGRTKVQMYSGDIDLATIAAVKSAVDIPVLGNGNITDAEGARRMLDATGCDGLMIGRGAVGNPFLFAELTAAAEGKAFTPPTLGERCETALLQLTLAIAEKGEFRAVRESRKSIAEYLSGFRGAATAREAINRAETYSEIEAIFSRLTQ